MDLRSLVQSQSAMAAMARPTSSQDPSIDFFRGICESLFEIRKFIRSKHGEINIDDVEMEVRLGMIVTEDRRWKPQIESRKVVIVPERQGVRVAHNLEFKSGIDFVQIDHLRQMLSDFSTEKKPTQCLRIDVDGNRWEVNADGNIGKGENKSRIAIRDLALLSYQYDIRIAAATECAVLTSAPTSFAHERTKRRTTYTSPRLPSWFVDFTEVETRALEGSHMAQDTLKTVKDVEVEFELTKAASAKWLRMDNEQEAVEETTSIANQLSALISLCVSGNSETAQEGEMKKGGPQELRQTRELVEALRASASVTRSMEFIGSMPVNMTRRNLTVLQRNKYFITEKSDGQRLMLFVVSSMSGSPEAVLVNRKQDICFPHGAAAIGAALGLGTILDGELVYNISLRRSVYVVFDVLSCAIGMDTHAPGRPSQAPKVFPCCQLPFSERLRILSHKIMPRYESTSRPPAHTPLIWKIFWSKEQFTDLLANIRSEEGQKVFFGPDRRPQHKTDGVIFQPDTPYRFGSDPLLMKWKWPEMRSVDLQAVVDPSRQMQERVKLLCGGPDGTQIDCSKRLGDHVGVGKFDSYRLLADIGDDHPKTPHIVEVMYDTTVGMWRYLHLRKDKKEPNYIDTVMGVMMEQAEAISAQEMEYRLLATSEGEADDFTAKVALFQQQVAEKRRSERRGTGGPGRVRSAVVSGGEGSTSASGPKVAVIVPFRDLHPEQRRQEHLKAFVPRMTQFLEAAGAPFKVFIVEQSSDDRKFNRGKLLNIGFDMACKEGYQVFVFHDVDLLPSPELTDYYVRIPQENRPVHIARVWQRYSGNTRYFGGVVAFSETQFKAINGFPNNFWGWGGEDDEMYTRTKEAGFQPTFPTRGALEDMESMSLEDKLTTLRSHSLWKCMNKTEVLQEHKDTWRSNGLSNLRYKELSRSSVGHERVSMVRVDVCLNGHWTDVACSLDDNQMGSTLEEYKARFAATSSARAAPVSSMGGPNAGASSIDGQGEWKKATSKKHGKDYWWNTVTKETVWTDPHAGAGTGTGTGGGAGAGALPGSVGGGAGGGNGSDSSRKRPREDDVAESKDAGAHKRIATRAWDALAMEREAAKVNAPTFPFLRGKLNIGALVERLRNERAAKKELPTPAPAPGVSSNIAFKFEFTLSDDDPGLVTRAVQETIILKTRLKVKQGANVVDLPSFWEVWGRADKKLEQVVISSRDPHEEIWRQQRAFGYKIATTFMPGYAKALYEHFGAREVLDPCAGWGDRMVGAASTSSPQVTRYVAFDPNAPLRPGYAELLSLFGNSITEFSADKMKFSNGFEIHSMPFEAGAPHLESDSFDLVFTSPPFFEYEMYNPSNPQYRDWLTDFYTPLMQQSCRCVRPGGHVVIHIGDTSAGNIAEFMTHTVQKICSLTLQHKIGLRGMKSDKLREVWVYRKPLDVRGSLSVGEAQEGGRTRSAHTGGPVGGPAGPGGPRGGSGSGPSPGQKPIAGQGVPRHVAPSSGAPEADSRRRLVYRLTNPPLRLDRFTHEGRTFTLFDDGQCIGGSKQRLLGRLLGEVSEHEVIYAGPDGGIAQVALAYTARLWGKKATIFLNTSCSKEKPPLARLAAALGADMHYTDSSKGRTLAETQADATKYSESSSNRKLMPFGLRSIPGEPNFDLFRQALIEAIPPGMQPPRRLWLVAGSGFLLDVLHSIWPSTKFMVVQVGKKVWPDQLENKLHELYIAPENFAAMATEQPPFRTVPWYDAKLWQFAKQHGLDGDAVWNVGSVPDHPEAAAAAAIESIARFSRGGQ